MADILDRFMEAAKQNVSSGYYMGGEPCFGKRISLRKKIEKQDFLLITEIKHASPAGEYSFDNIDVRQAAADFADCGSDAISVVVEPQIFKGHLSNVAAAKKASGLPVLFKDFVISEKQIEAAHRVGADAVLLVVKVADRLGLDLDGLISQAHSLGLEVLLETYDAQEMKKAMRTDADLLGINNRDLKTFKTDLNTTKNLVIKYKKDLEGKIIVSESGIFTNEDVKSLMEHNVYGFLVGESLMREEDIEMATKKILGI